MDAQQHIKQISDALKALKASKKSAAKTSLTDFKSQQISTLKATIDTACAALEKELHNNGMNAQKYITAIKVSATIEEKEAALEHISEMIADLPEQSAGLTMPQIDVPIPVRDEMNADIQELKRCFAASCYRSAVVLCGRLLETALHRTYFELAGQDLLEKSPGMGLGNLIARIEEKGIKLDPGLTNQIHLINQVRIYSVHKKQEPFYPTQTQAQAIILYTMDALKKLFAKKV